ncbi:hypothetical protein REPUB_Repub02eG0196600 [Reevesia pubescens]
MHHASFVMNFYYQANGRHLSNCDFRNSALVSLTDPKVGAWQSLEQAMTTCSRTSRLPAARWTATRLISVVHASTQTLSLTMPRTPLIFTTKPQAGRNQAVTSGTPVSLSQMIQVMEIAPTNLHAKWPQGSENYK